MRDALDEISEADSSKLWRKIFALCDFKRPTDTGTSADYRNTDMWKSSVIDKSVTLLQQT